MENMLDGFGGMEGMDLEQLLSKFEELSSPWKIPATVNFSRDALAAFGFDRMEDVLPEAVYGRFVRSWNTYSRIRELVDLKGGEEGDAAQRVDLPQESFRQFEHTIFNAQECVLNGMRMCNMNGAFPVPDSPELLFWYSPFDAKDLKEIHTLLVFLLGRLQRMRLRRYDGFVYQQVFMGDKPTHAWEERCDIPDMVRYLCPKSTAFVYWKIMTSGGNFDAAVRYLSTCRDAEFPELIVKRRVWSFNDGVYDASNDSFVTYDQPIDEYLVSGKIIKMDFAPCYSSGPPLVSPRLVYGDLHTPRFDGIFEPQGWGEDMLWWMFVFLGRLFYGVNEEDSWQVIPFLKGVAGTGKSTVIKVVQLMYNTRDVGVISNNIEKKFGLSTIFYKTVFVVPELKSDFAMDQADFQSMVTGEQLSLAQKNKAPLTGQWTVPGIMAGNEAAGWEDKSGSISRRIVVFDFPNRVPPERLNPNLINEIRDGELPTIIRKCALAYSEALAKFRGGDIWTVVPPRMRAEKKKMQFSTNPLYAFLGSDHVELDPDEYTLESLFVSRLKSFAAEKFPSSVITFNSDYYSYIFAEFGLAIRRESLPWPRSTVNEQAQSYVMGCRINESL